MIDKDAKGAADRFIKKYFKEDLTQLTREQRVERVTLKIKELGILDFSDAMCLEDIEMIIESLEQFEEAYPSELIAHQLKFIEKHRDTVWKTPKGYQHFYFDWTQKLSHFLFKHTNMTYDDIFNHLDKLFPGDVFLRDVERFHVKGE